jgi:hypothetical protein
MQSSPGVQISTVWEKSVVKEFHVIDGVHFRFFGVDKVNIPFQHTPVEAITFFENHEVSIKTFDRNVLFVDAIDYIILCPCLEPLRLDCAALQFLTSCFVFDAVVMLQLIA